MGIPIKYTAGALIQNRVIAHGLMDAIYLPALLVNTPIRALNRYDGRTGKYVDRLEQNHNKIIIIFPESDTRN